MIIPALSPLGSTESSISLDVSKLPLVIQESDEQDATGGWSPIIGVVTAIVGNILISFALNTQRYAHVRLEREQNGELEKAEQKHNVADTEEGQAQSRIAEDRARKNKQAGRPDAHDTPLSDEEDADESSALIPKLQSRQNTADSKTSHKSTQQQGNGQRKSYLRSPLWWIGITLMVLGESGNFLAYGFAPASIVSPLGVVALISNCLIAPLFLHEQFRKRDLLGVVVAVGGTVTIVLSAQSSNPKLGPDEIWELVKRWEFLVYFGVTLAAIITLMVLSNKIGEKTILIDIGLVGLFGGYTALSTKGVASLLSYRLWRTLTFPITYALVAVLIVTAVLQIKYVNRALQRFDSTRVIPTQFVCFTIFVIVGSAVLYRDFEAADGEQAGKFVGGCGLTFLGVWLLTSGRRDGDDEGDIDLKGDEEQQISLVDETTPPVTPTNRTTSVSQLTGASYSTTSFMSAVSCQSHQSDGTSTPTPPFRLSQRKSTSAVPTLEQQTQAAGGISQSSLTPAPPTPGAVGQSEEGRKRLLTPRPSLSMLFAPSSFSPLTTPLSSGLSVVVADQRGRLARTGSARGPSYRGSVMQGTEGIDGTPVRRGSRRAGSGGRDGNGLTSVSRAGSRSSAEVSNPGVETVVDERPRVGRGATVEVMPTQGETERRREGSL